MATHIGVARSDEPCLEAVVAARLTSAARAEARLIRADLRRQPLRDLTPDPAEVSIPVDLKPNPFTSPAMADRYLRDIPSADDVIRLPVSGLGSWEQHARYATARASASSGRPPTIRCPVSSYSARATNSVTETGAVWSKPACARSGQSR